MFKYLVLAISIVSLNADAGIFSPVSVNQIPRGEPPKISLPAVEDPNLFVGKTVAILASHGVEESEITFPYRYLTDRGAKVDVLVPSWAGPGIVASQFLMPSLFVKATGTFKDGQQKNYDLLVLTGGAWNAQVVRSDDEALRLIQNHYRRGQPLAAICAGTVVLINAGLTNGLTMTGSPVVKTDLINSGAKFADQPVVFSRGIVTSRTPDDLPYFVAGIKRVLLQ